MYCPKCKSEFRKGFTKCADCGIPLVNELPTEPPLVYKKYVSIYSPKNEVELAFIKSVLDGESIPYYVHNDHFGSLEIGFSIRLFNAKTIMVHEEDLERAQELISEFLNKTESEAHASTTKYTLSDKIRLVLEFLLFGWAMPGRKSSKKNLEED